MSVVRLTITSTRCLESPTVAGIGSLEPTNNGVPASSPYAQLIRLLEGMRGESHLVILQGTPDPDAISSALALEFIGAQFEITTTVLSFHSLSHHENRALVKKLGIKLLRYDDQFDASQYAAYSIVDSQRHETPIDKELIDSGVEFLAFIDHHGDHASPPLAMLVDVRPQYSATATILSEYLMQAFPKGLEPADAQHVRLATALMHGLRSDTNKFLLASKAEHDAASFLAPCVDNALIESIERKVLTTAMLGILENALVNRRVHDNFIFSHVGSVRAVDRDGIPQAAELLLNREGTDTVLVWGVVDDSFIDGSLRTRSETINPDEFIKGFLGVSPENGKYYGGGTIRDRGGFQIPLGFLAVHQDKNLLYKMSREIVETSFLDYIGKAVKGA